MFGYYNTSHGRGYFFALPNDGLVVTSSSSGGIVGNGIINNSSTPDGTIFEFLGGSGAQVEVDYTGGSPDVFDDDQAGSHIITDGGGIVANGNSFESESIINMRALDINGDPTGPEIAIFVFSQNGAFGVFGAFLLICHRMQAPPKSNSAEAMQEARTMPTIFPVSAKAL